MGKKKIRNLGKYDIGIVKHQAGGMNNYVFPTILDDSEAKLLKNVSLKEKGIVQPCPGRLKRFASVFDASNACNGIYAYYPDTATSRLLMGAGTTIYKDTPHVTYKWTDQANFEETNAHRCNCDTSTTAGDIKVKTTLAAPTFARNSVKYKKNGVIALANVPTYETGKFSNGIHIEEPTANIVSANQSNIETDTTGFGTNGGGVTLTKDTSEHWEGLASLKAVCNGSGTDQGWITPTISVDASGTYTYSVWVKGSGNLILYIFEYDAEPAFIGEAHTFLTATGTWTRYTVTKTMTASGAYARLILVTTTAQAVTFYSDGIQLEKKAYATSWQIGGTPRVTDSLYYTLSADLPNEWFMSGVWVPDQASTISRTDSMVLAALFNDNNNWVGIIYYPPDDKLHITKYYSGTNVGFTSEALSFTAGQIIEWGIAQLSQTYGDLVAGTHLWYRINGGTVVHVNNTDTNIPTALTQVYIGCLNGYEANGVIDEAKLVDLKAELALGTTINNAWAEGFLTAASAPTADNATLMLCQFDDATTAAAKTGFVWVSASKDISAAADMGSGKAEYSDTVPGSSSVVFKTRTSTDNSTWDAWTAIDGSGNIGSTHHNYIQLSVIGTISGSDSPSLQDATLSYDGTPTAASLQTGFTAGSQFYFATLNSTLIEMNKLDAPMKWDGSAATMSALGGSPPHCQYVAAHKNRLFAAHTTNYPSRLYYSDALTTETWGALSYIDINPDDGDYITGILIYDDYLIVTKNRSLWVLVGSSSSDFAVKRISSSIGCIAPRSLIRMDEYFSFVSSEGIYRSDLSSPMLISERTEETWNTLNSRRLYQAAAAYFDHILRVDVPYGASTTNDYTICYSTIGQHLYVKDLTKHASCYTTLTEAGEEVLLFGHATEGQVSKEDYGTSDDGAAIVMDWETKHFDHGLTAVEKKIKKLYVTVIANTSSVAASVYLVVNGVENATPLTFTAAAQTVRKAVTYELRPGDIDVSKFKTLGYRITTSTTNGGLKFVEVVPEFKVKKLKAS